MSAPSHYPLAWPFGKPRTPSGQRKPGRFSSHGQSLSVAVAADRVEEELERLGARLPIVSTNVEPTLSGRPRSGQREPGDPGVCVYFQMAGRPYAMACDRYLKVADNLAAIAAHIEATRKIERHGVASAAETLQAFQALPAPAGASPPRHWREVLCVPVGPVTRGDVGAQYRRLAAESHPDAPGGSHEKMAELNAARDAALKELSE